MNEIGAFGAKLVRLGFLLQNPEATVEQVAAAAYEAGLRLEFRIIPDEPSSPQSEG